MDLLKKALTSKSPLSNVLLANGEFNQMYPSYVYVRPPLHNVTSIINLKVTVSKSKKKIVYAEAQAEFAEFLFSFLTTHIGFILAQLNDIFSFGCMNNLHKSVKELDPSCFIRPIKGKNLFKGKSPYVKIESDVGFVKRLSKFVVWDNLQVTPLENTASSIAFLQKLNIPLDDLEEHVVGIGRTVVNTNLLLNIDTLK